MRPSFPLLFNIPLPTSTPTQKPPIDPIPSPTYTPPLLWTRIEQVVGVYDGPPAAAAAPAPAPAQAPAAAGGNVRKLVVEVVDARDLVPKDGQGSCSAYAVVDFDGQRKRTPTAPRDLNPQWHHRLEFVVSEPAAMDAEELDVELYHDRRFSAPSSAPRKNQFLGRVRICGSQFARRGDEGIIYFPLEKRNLLSWVRGEIGLKIYYYDEPAPPPPEEKQPDSAGAAEPPAAPDHSAAAEEPKELPEVPAPTEAAVEIQQLPPPSPLPPGPKRPLRRRRHTRRRRRRWRIRTRRRSRRSNGGDYHPAPAPVPGPAHAPRVISGRFVSSAEPVERVQTTYDLVEPMQYLFVRVVRARGLRPCESPYVKVRTGSQSFRSKPARDSGSGEPEWSQVFALSHAKPEPTLEISVWDGAPAAADAFLGGVCFDLSDVPVRDQPDGPLAPQWYRLEGSEPGPRSVSGDIMVPQAVVPPRVGDRGPGPAAPRGRGPGPCTPFDVRVKVQLGFQSARTRRSTVSGSGSTFSWAEDLMFVAAEPLDDQLVVLVEDRSAAKDPALLGLAAVPVSSVEQRLDERHVPASRWVNLEAEAEGGYRGRVHLRLCLEGGYHVLDEAAHVCSDYRPTAKQLWKPPVGVLELGILGARGLLPMKTKGGGGGKGSTDAYCVAKYGRSGSGRGP
uniref:C2 domain-containing protein n=1 Tax=Ananas comosus var. bracteatus TaxID=296719 RepID=A0A6V7P082_ANACO|nr:unnamed protein product [Ananas comosus var. bracteatus]